MKSKTKKTEQIREMVEKFSGVQTESFGNRTRMTIGFEVLDNEDITSSISALLEVCYYALDGNGVFLAPKQQNKNQMSSVTKVLEMVIDLLPHDQMHCLDQITKILSNEKKQKPHKEQENHKNKIINT